MVLFGAGLGLGARARSRVDDEHVDGVRTNIKHAKSGGVRMQCNHGSQHNSLNVSPIARHALTTFANMTVPTLGKEGGHPMITIRETIASA